MWLMGILLSLQIWFKSTDGLPGWIITIGSYQSEFFFWECRCHSTHQQSSRLTQASLYTSISPNPTDTAVHRHREWSAPWEWQCAWRNAQSADSGVTPQVFKSWPRPGCLTLEGVALPCYGSLFCTAKWRH